MNIKLQGTFVLFLFVVTGCSSKKPEVTDPEEARTLLVEVLEAWQQGAAPGEFAQRDPSTHVADEEWLAGAKLLRFQIQDTGHVVGPSLRSRVVLYLQGSRGEPLTQTVVYQVTTRPSRSVVRSDSK